MYVICKIILKITILNYLKSHHKIHIRYRIIKEGGEFIFILVYLFSTSNVYLTWGCDLYSIVEVLYMWQHCSFMYKMLAIIYNNITFLKHFLSYRYVHLVNIGYA